MGHAVKLAVNELTELFLSFLSNEDKYRFALRMANRDVKFEYPRKQFTVHNKEQLEQRLHEAWLRFTCASPSGLVQPCVFVIEDTTGLRFLGRGDIIDDSVNY